MVIFVVGGIGGVYFQQRVLPWVRSNSMLSRIDFLKKTAENITVINRNEQITVKEDDSISQLALQNLATVAEIISVNTQNAKNLQTKGQIATQSKIGTALIVTSDGMLVTYRSAILEEDAKYSIVLNDSSKHEATLVGIDEFSNLAFFKIDASGLPVATFSDSSSLMVGRKMFELSGDQKYAAGILTSKDKTFNLGGMLVSSSEKLEGVLRVDLNQDEDFLGAPVLTYNGEVAGITGMLVIDNKQTYFQIPANVIKNSLDLALSQKLDQRPFFGAYYVPLTKEYAIEHGIENEKGALVFAPSGKQNLAFIDGAPAQKAGLKIGDIIIKIDEQELDLDNSLSNILGSHKKGDQVELTVKRAGEELKIAVKI